MTDYWHVQPFGSDCLGNVTGYMVCRHSWQYTGNPYRADGLNLIHEVAERFVGDIYEPGAHERAYNRAVVLAAKLNPPVPHQSAD